MYAVKLPYPSTSEVARRNIHPRRLSEIALSNDHNAPVILRHIVADVQVGYSECPKSHLMCHVSIHNNL